jgi:hypothetical protein
VANEIGPRYVREKMNLVTRESEFILASLVRRPAYSRTRHSRDYSWPHALKEPSEAFPSLYKATAFKETIDVPQFSIRGCSSCL